MKTIRLTRIESVGTPFVTIDVTNPIEIVAAKVLAIEPSSGRGSWVYTSGPRGPFHVNEPASTVRRLVHEATSAVGDLDTSAAIE